jgi:hypothetical protein
MASIVLSMMGVIDYQDYRTVFRHAMFRSVVSGPMKKIGFCFLPEKPKMKLRESDI